MKKPVFGSGWKMFLTDKEAMNYAQRLKENIPGEQDAELFVLPSFTAVERVTAILAGTDINVGVQNMCWEEKGAFTGEVSVLSLKEMAVKYVEIGHSERRTLFGETDRTVNLKIGKAMEHGLVPIFCMGEELQEKEKNLAKELLSIEIKNALHGIPYADAKKIIYAYEPVWAIGMEDSAQPDYAQEILGFIRQLLAQIYGRSEGTEFTVVYGGSVSLKNVEELISQPDIDGVFVGRASLSIESYMEMLDIIKDSWSKKVKKQRGDDEN
ncbi:triose-phosphate isomerase [Ruminiclostridium cellobioparum]|uniref:triose-phosphate isomerase n=1 Tax=Ruminiclostridium cellobioparum TaxID=29355 RepID=UPI000688ED70|nr:triose-phosphate isomerase [Ruminiclostridium cellobioparum]